MSAKVKWMHSGFAGAPVITDAWGSLTDLLDACLVNGYNLKTVSALTWAAGVATATVGAGHGYVLDQIVTITGADQADYNGEFTVTAVTGTTISFALGGTPVTPATGASITCKTSALGWDIEFSGANKRVYRSPNVLGTRNRLRVDASLPAGYTTTWAKFARVTQAVAMSDVDTFTNIERAPYDPASPNKNEVPQGSGSTGIYGWFKWYWSRGPNTEMAGPVAVNSWAVIGDDRLFYLVMQQGQSQTIAYHVYAFGDFASYRAGSQYASILFAADAYRSAATSGAPNAELASGAHDTSGRIMIADHTGVSGNVRVGLMSLAAANAQQFSGFSTDFAFPNGPDYSLLIAPIYVKNETGKHLAGVLPGAHWILQQSPYAHLSVIDGVTGYPGKKFVISKAAHIGAGGDNSAAAVAFDITGPWAY